MPITRRLKELFDQAEIPYEVYNHPLAYTAQEVAARQHFSGDQMAKVVMLKVDGKLVMGVITGSQKIHLPTVSESLESLRVTRVVIAHRLSTIRHADKIVVLEKGRVVQIGRFDELVAVEGPFKKLAQRQMV